jgi:hypothetical protein
VLELAFVFAPRAEWRIEFPILCIRRGNVNELQSIISIVADNQSVAINAHSTRIEELTGAFAFGAERSDECPIAFE